MWDQLEWTDRSIQPLCNSALPVTSARRRAIILRAAAGRRPPPWRSAVATVVLFLAQIAIYHIECRFGGLLSHGERNQSTQPG